jgi:hypothetical protein
MSVVIPSLRAAIAVPSWAKNELWRRARAVPSLDLRFADNKSLTDAVTGASLVTFTRASSGTFVDSAGVIQTAATDVPRFDHNPTTLESLGLLVEEQRTNLCLQSENLGTTWTTAAVSVTANQRTAPDGALSMDTVTATGGAGFLQQAITVVNSTVYAASVYVFATSNRTRLILHNGSSDICNIAWTSISANTTSVSGTASSIASTLVGNGIYRLSFTFTSTSTTANFRIQPLDSSGNAVTGATGDFWGAQLEAASTPGSYIPTTTAAVTRSASLADLISSAIANNIRTLYLEFRSPASGTRGVVSLNDNTADERVNVLTSGTDPRLVVVDGGVEQANVNGGTVTANQRTRIAVRINANDFAISINGGAVVTDASGTLPTVDRLMLGRTQAGEYLNGTIARATGWTQLLPDSTLQSLAQ